LVDEKSNGEKNTQHDQGTKRRVKPEKKNHVSQTSAKKKAGNEKMLV